MKRIIIYIVVLSVFAGCKTPKLLEVEKVIEHTEYETKYNRDSIYIHDSTYIYSKGDTVYQDRWRTKYIDRLRTDTFIKTDSLRVPVPYYVEKELSLFDRLKMDSAVPMTIIALLMTCALLYRVRN